MDIVRALLRCGDEVRARARAPLCVIEANKEVSRRGNNNTGGYESHSAEWL